MPTRVHRLLIASVLGLFLALLTLPNAQAATPIITYYHLDALGSPLAATDAQGNVLWKETYTAYGDRLQNAMAANTNTRWYTGHPDDSEVGLSYFGARWYDASLGRFMGVDPQAYREGQVHTYNQFAYANNNPYRYTDPDGRSTIDERLRNAMGQLPDAGFGPGGTGGGSWRFGYKSSPQAMAEAEQRAAQRLEESLTKGARPPNMSPPGAGRQGALNEAKRARGIPTSQQPDRTLPNIDKRGNLQPGRVYEYDLPAPGGGIRIERIRDDAAGHIYTDNPSQNRGPHFNDAAKKHYDY